MDFRWNRWNVEHIERHGVSPEAAEEAVCAARGRWPRRIGGDKWMAWGRGPDGELVQVVFLLDPEGAAFVIHARPLTARERRRWRRSMR